MRHNHGEGKSAHRPAAFEERLADEARFLKTWFENPLGTGAVSPSSRSLARAMARYVDPDLPGPVIELGPGTGPVTEALIRRGIAAERLILVEFDPTFCRLLARRYPRAAIIEGDAYRLAETLRGVLDGPAAAIVSSLPLLTRPDRARLDLLEQAFGLLRPGAAFVQFTYGITSPIPRRRPCALSFNAEASAPVWLNIPPARVWVYRAATESDPTRQTDPAGMMDRRDAEPNHGFRLNLKTGTELLSEELRESGGKIRFHLRSKAERARAELRAGAEMVKSGLKRKAARTDGWDGPDLLGARAKGRGRR